jgi:hypothetical protein
LQQHKTKGGKRKNEKEIGNGEEKELIKEDKNRRFREARDR